MIRASCHCGGFALEVNVAPTEITDCSCSICRRYGVLWAYYSPKDVRFDPANGPSDTHSWRNRSIAFHRCHTCGCVSHWAAFDLALDRMGINARLLAPELLVGVRVRHLDGANTEQYID